MSQPGNPTASTAADILVEDVPDFFKVYIKVHKHTYGNSMDVCYELLCDKKLSPKSCAFLSRAKLIGATSTRDLTRDSRLAFKRIVGEAMALAIRGDLQSQQGKVNAPDETKVSAADETKVLAETAETLLKKAENFLADRYGEIARMWYVQATVVLLVLLYLLFALLTFFSYTKLIARLEEKSNSVQKKTVSASNSATVTKEMIEESSLLTIRLYGLAIMGGALGAGFSLLSRVGKLSMDPAAGRWSHYGEVAFRLTIGALAAMIILFGMEANVFAGILKVSNESGLIDLELYARTFWIIGIFSIAAGYSERFVPSLLEQLSSKSGETKEAKSPPDKTEPQSNSTPNG